MTRKEKYNEYADAIALDTKNDKRRAEKIRSKLKAYFDSPDSTPTPLEFATAECVYLREQHQSRKAHKVEAGDIDPVRERARKERAMADKIELELAIKREELVDGHEVQAFLTDLVLQVKSSLLAVPSRMATVLEAENDPRVIEQLLDTEIRDALTALADANTED